MIIQYSFMKSSIARIKILKLGSYLFLISILLHLLPLNKVSRFFILKLGYTFFSVVGLILELSES